MILEDRIQIDVSPERIFDFFEQMETNYLEWHPDHLAFRWREGRGLNPGVVFYFEEYIGGTLMKKTVRFSRVERYRYIEFEPTWWLMRLIMPRISFEVQPRGESSLLI
ncbi:MAG: SRPBCC family protein, partial [Gemmatimonadota bacterium]